MTTVTLNPLDMKGALNFYVERLDSIQLPPERTVATLPFPIIDQDFLEINEPLISALWHLFPAQARHRAHVCRLKGMPPLWFHCDSDWTTRTLKTTEDLMQAISPTAIVPSYIDNSRWPKKSWIHLHALPLSIRPGIAKIIHAQGFLHEVAHAIINPSLYGNQQLELPCGEVLDGSSFIIERFAVKTEKLEPISHYSSFYRTVDGTYPEGKDGLTAISEELSEAIAAYLLGFVYCSNPIRQLLPFAGRRGVKNLVEQFLYAKAFVE